MSYPIASANSGAAATTLAIPTMGAMAVSAAMSSSGVTPAESAVVPAH